MTAPVFLAELAGVAAAQDLTVTGGEARHAYVMRLTAGDAVDLVDGAGLRARCTVTHSERDAVAVRVKELVREQDACRLVLVQALAKAGRDEAAVETATEVGVDAVYPWQANRAIVKWSGTKTAKAVAKWQDTARAAMKQSRRARLPHVAQPVDSRALAALVGAAVQEGAQVFVLHEEAHATLPTELGAPPQAWVVVGPEGGIAPEELQALRAAGATAVRLGPYVMRSSTAGPVALSHLARALGRWNA